MVKTLRKGFLALVLAVAALFTLASCVLGGGTTTPETDPTKDAQTALNEFTANVTFANAEAVTTSFNLPIAGKKSGFNIPISWTSSDDAVIAVVDLMENGAPSAYYKQAKVTRPAFDQEDATVTLTAEFSLTYQKTDGTNATLKTQKTYTFVVVKETSEIAKGNLASIKEAAGKFYFEENGVAAGTSSASGLAYPVEFEATVTAVLGADGAGQFTVSDGSAGIYVYSNKTTVKVGDKVLVKGDITVYYGTLQVGSNIDVTVLGASDQTVEFKPATPGEINAMSTADGMYGGQTLKVSGTLLYGKYNNGSSDSFWLEDAQTGSQIELYYKSFTAAEKEALQAYAGKFVEIDAVTYDTYSKSAPNDHRVFVIPSTIKEATAPELTDADKLAAAVNKVKAVSLAATYVDGQEFAFPTVDAEGAEITWVMDPATLLVDGKLVIAEAGTAKLIATIKVADLTETVELTINVAKEVKQEPVVTNKTVAELIALTTEMDAKYTVTGKVALWGNKLESTDTAATMYGNFILEGEDGSKIIVYGASATATALTFDATTGKYSYSNAKDFLTNALTSTIAVGDTVELVVVRTSYNGNPQLNAIVTKVTKAEGGETPETPDQPGTPDVPTGEVLNATLNYTAGTTANMVQDTNNAATVNLDATLFYVNTDACGSYANKIGLNKDGSIRLYANAGNGNHLTITIAEGYKIVGIEITLNSGNAATCAVTVDGVAVTGENYKYEFVGQTVVVYNNADSGQFRMDSIKISYAAVAGGETPETPEQPETPTHEHTLCETCGKCTAEDCDGTDKCAGHEVAPEEPTYLTVAEVKAVASGTTVAVKGVVIAKGTESLLIQDATGAIMLYKANSQATFADVKVGDEVASEGKYSPYNGLHEVANLTSLTVVSASTAPAVTELAAIDAATIESLQCQIVSIELTYVEGNVADKSNAKFTDANGTSVTVRGDAKWGTIESVELTAGDKVKVIAFVNWYNGAQLTNVSGYTYVEKLEAPHTHTEEVVPGKEATCTEKGLTEGKKCSECGEVLVAQEEIAVKEHSFTEGKCTVCGADDPNYVAPEKPDMTLVDEFAAKIVADFNATGASDAKVTTREEFKGTTHPNIKYVFNNAEKLAEYKWFFEFALAEMTAAAEASNSLSEDTFLNTKELLEKMIAGDTTAVGGSYADGRTAFRWWIQGVINGTLPPAEKDVYDMFMVDYSVAENLNRFIEAYQNSKQATPETPEQPGTTAEPVAVLETNGNSNFWGAYTNTVFLNEGGLISNAQFSLRIEISEEADGTLKVTQVVESGVKEFAFAGKYGIVISESHADYWTKYYSLKVAVGQYVTIEGDATTGVATLKFYAENPNQGEAPAPHTHTEEVVPGKEATCTEAGLTEGKKCSECGETLVAQEEIAVKEHNFAEGKCTVCGADDPNYVAPEQPAEKTATITFDNTSKRTEYSTSKQVWQENGVTVTNNKAASTSNVGDYSKPARFYASSELIVEIANITKIVFDCNSASYATALQNSITDATVTVSSDKVTVVFDTPVDSFKVAKLSAQVRIDAIEVTYNA